MLLPGARSIVSRVVAAAAAAATGPLPWRPIRMLATHAPALRQRGVLFMSSQSETQQAAAAAAATVPDSYFASKRAAKERRRKTYQIRQERQQRLQTRRQGRDGRGQQRATFRRFWLAKKIDEEYHERKARQASLDWQIQVAVIVERYPVVLPDMEPFEQDMDELQAHLAQYGKQYPAQLMPRQRDDNVEILVRNEDIMAALSSSTGFTPAPRVTAADESGAIDTIHRKLPFSLYFTIQNEEKWTLPTTIVQDDETLLQAAVRVATEAGGSQLETWSVTNAPCAVHLEPWLQQQQHQYYGTKTFFIKIAYDEGDVATTNTSFAWLDRTEVAEKVGGNDQRMRQFYHYLLV